MLCSYTSERYRPWHGEGTNACQYSAVLQPGDYYTVDGSQYCKYHLPSVGARGIATEKASWSEGQIEKFNGEIFEQIDRARVHNEVADLTGIVFPGAVDFTKYASIDTALPPISFIDAVFNDIAIFRSVVFSAMADFDSALFFGGGSFGGTSFHAGCSFRKAFFHSTVNFIEAKFCSGVDFMEVKFQQLAIFSGSSFDSALFLMAEFVDDATFDNVVFGGEANFAESIFASAAKFRKCRFHRDAIFFDTSFSTTCSFTAASFAGSADFSSFSGAMEPKNKFIEKPQKYRGTIALARESIDYGTILPNAFSEVDFSDCKFSGNAKFSNRRFNNKTNFTNATFSKPPSFYNAELHQDTTFRGARFPSSPGTEAAKSYRTLRLVSCLVSGAV